MAENEQSEVDILPMPVMENGSYYCPWTNWKKPSKTSALYWMACEKNHSNIPAGKTNELDKNLPIVKPDFNRTEEGVHVTWLGHATLLIKMDNLTILTDPMFSMNASPVAMGARRFRPPPCKISELPRIDVVVISHNHYDHLDLRSVQELAAQFTAIRWFVPLGLKNWMEQSGCRIVKELNWWQEVELENHFKVVCTPAQHWSQRGVFDTNKTLWGSWCILGPKHRFFFAGDTGYPGDEPRQKIFEMIGKRYGPFDVAGIPIGAYAPRWMMQEQHVDPQQAVKIHKDIGAQNSVAIHWGTFALANEFYMEPKLELDKAMNGIGKTNFMTLQHGETKTFTKALTKAKY